MENLVQQLSNDGASCTLFWDAPRWDGTAAIAIGAFKCASVESGAALLREAEALAREKGVKAAIGPMDGDTWRAYRVVTESDGSKPFLLEPTSGPHDHDAFHEAGFQMISRYMSSKAPIDRVIGEPAPAIDGLRIEPWDGEGADELIGQLFQLSSQAFAGNAFFKPITKEAFLQLYAPVMPLIDPRLVLFVRGPAGNIVGFLFALIDTTGPEKRVIMKTYASAVRGCGRWLLDTGHRIAAELGCTEVIHALMHEDNASLDRSNRAGATIFRRYALMGKRLAD